MSGKFAVFYGSEDACGFCRRGRDVEDSCGKLYMSPECSAHKMCMQYSSLLVQYTEEMGFGGFKIEEVKQEMKRCRTQVCSICQSSTTKQASAGCGIKKCRKIFHFCCITQDAHATYKRLQCFRKREGTVVLYEVFCSQKHLNLYLEKNRKSLKTMETDTVSDDENFSMPEPRPQKKTNILDHHCKSSLSSSESETSSNATSRTSSTFTSKTSDTASITSNDTEAETTEPDGDQVKKRCPWLLDYGSEEKCGFCGYGQEVEDTCGKLLTKADCSAHRKCMLYSSGLVQWEEDMGFGGFDVVQVKQEMKRCRTLKCHLCKSMTNKKASAGCGIKKCFRQYHFLCVQRSGVAMSRRIKCIKKNEKEEIQYEVFCGKEHETKFFDTKRPAFISMKEDPVSDDDNGNKQSSTAARASSTSSSPSANYPKKKKVPTATLR